jgi:hypothetical protein
VIENQPQPSLGPDIIDNLAHPTTCNFIVLVGGGYRMEVGRGLVYPNLALLDDVLIDNAIYVVVKVDMVHENVKSLKLEVPLDDTTPTLHDVVTRRVQWRRTNSDVDQEALVSITPEPSPQSPHWTQSRLPSSPTLTLPEQPRP